MTGNQGAMSSTLQPASQRSSLPGSTRSLARASESGRSNKVPSTRQFAVSYRAFYDVEDLNESTMDKVRAIKNKTYGIVENEGGAVVGNHRINTGMR